MHVGYRLPRWDRHGLMVVGTGAASLVCTTQVPRQRARVRLAAWETFWSAPRLAGRKIYLGSGLSGNQALVTSASAPQTFLVAVSRGDPVAGDIGRSGQSLGEG